MTKFKIFGQEPAFYVGVVEAALALFLSFGWFDLSQEKVGVIVATVAAIFAFVTAYATKTTAFSALVGLAKAGFVLAVTFGAPLSDNQTGAAIAFITIVAGAYLRDRTAAIDTPVSNASPGAAEPDVVVSEVPAV